MPHAFPTSREDSPGLPGQASGSAARWQGDSFSPTWNQSWAACGREWMRAVRCRRGPELQDTSSTSHRVRISGWILWETIPENDLVHESKEKANLPAEGWTCNAQMRLVRLAECVCLETQDCTSQQDVVWKNLCCTSLLLVTDRANIWQIKRQVTRGKWCSGTLAAWKGTVSPALCQLITPTNFWCSANFTLHSCCNTLKRDWQSVIIYNICWIKHPAKIQVQSVLCFLPCGSLKCNYWELFSGEILPYLHQDSLHRKPSHLSSKTFIIMFGEHNDRDCKNKQTRKQAFKVGQGVVALEKWSFMRLGGCCIKMKPSLYH